ncbi:MAG: argininosuccinate lyase [Alphaproteobacteria bacterium]|nr:argininosuccinate lyase [Alphaproteobacteria bacterium]
MKRSKKKSAAKGNPRTHSRANPQANPLWGGRFASGPDALMEQVNASIGFDKALATQDLAQSRAHCSMLVKAGILSAKDGHAILKGLAAVEREIAAGAFTFAPALEDIHMHVEARLAELIGEPAGRLHTARSRNDQVATDFRIWVRDAVDRIDAGLSSLQRVLLDRAHEHAETVLPGLTHLQPAQPVTFGHHLLAYFEMFDRDRGRFRDCRARLNESPLGAAALAGTTYPIDRKATAKALGFARPMENSMDAVSARDFALEFLAACSIAAVHLSRLGEELVIWASARFRFVRLSDAFSTGSSIMPQKRNPDAAELLRAKAGPIIGALNSLLVTMKGLPLTYSKDMQEDKVPTFAAAEQLELSLQVMAGMVADLTVNKDAMRAATSEGFLTATDLADWLVQELDMPFREAHGVVGRIVRLAEHKGVGLEQLSLGDLKLVEPRITADAQRALSVENAVARRRSHGGTAPKQVRSALKRARARWKQANKDAKR